MAPPLKLLSESWLGRSVPIAFQKYDCKHECPVWEYERQGQRLRLRNRLPRENRRPNGKRKRVSTFTYGSRSRIMRFVAGMDWSKLGPSMFVTLTYPDEVAHNDKDKRNKEQYLFLRYVEKYLGKRFCGLWRVEYMPRLSGARAGETLCHIHWIIFGVKFLPFELVRKWWQSAIGSSTEPMIHGKRLTDGKAAVRYVSKYVSKVPEISVKLDDVTYLNSGRHWGYHRKRDIPLCPTITFPLLDVKWIEFIRIKAGTRLKYLDLRFFETFTLLGDFAVKIAECVEGIHLTGEYWSPKLESVLGGEPPGSG